MIKDFKEFKLKQYAEYIGNIIGIYYFCYDKIHAFRIVKSWRELPEDTNIEKYKYLVGEKFDKGIICAIKYRIVSPDDFTVYYTDSDATSGIYHDTEGRKYYINDLIRKLGDNVEYVSRKLALNNRTINYRDEYFVDIKNSEYLYQRLSQQLSFILGSGVSKEYGSKMWDDLQKEFKTTILKINKGMNNAELDTLVNSMGFSSYTIPQLLKDISPFEYFNTIFESIYDDEKYNSAHNTTLEAVANVLIAQYEKYKTNQNIVTFNYDDHLERILARKNKLIKNDLKSIYNARFIDNAKYNVKHVHGFIPSTNKNIEDKHKNSIILSNYEYIDRYQDKKAFTYSTIFKQLDKVNILVGNSVTDYQEQKVLREHHKKYLSDYSYLFMVKNTNEPKWMLDYKFTYFFEMGLITYYFDSFEQLKTKLNNNTFKDTTK